MALAYLNFQYLPLGHPSALLTFCLKTDSDVNVVTLFGLVPTGCVSSSPLSFCFQLFLILIFQVCL